MRAGIFACSLCSFEQCFLSARNDVLFLFYNYYLPAHTFSNVALYLYKLQKCSLTANPRSPTVSTVVPYYPSFPYAFFLSSCQGAVNACLQEPLFVIPSCLWYCLLPANAVVSFFLVLLFPYCEC